MLPLVSLVAALAVPIAGQAQTTRPPPVVHPHGRLHPLRRHPGREVPGREFPLPLPPPLPNQPQAAAPGVAAKPVPAPAKKSEAAKKPEPSLPVPRFASLRTDEVNLRAGPGFRYPIEWVYKRRELPVEIERDFEVWRLILTPDGTRGWVHEATLTGRRTFVVQDKEVTMRSDPRDDARAVAQLMPGVIGLIRYCHKDSDWCRVRVGDHAGFLARSQFWGTLPGEIIPAP